MRRSLLISNADMASLLNALARAGLANTVTGAHLLQVIMPHERASRLHRDGPLGT